MLPILIVRVTNRLISGRISTAPRNRTTFDLISNQQRCIHVTTIGEILCLINLFLLNMYLLPLDKAYSTTTKVVKQQSYHQRYVNYAPVLYEWSQKLNSGQLTMDSLLASQQFQRVSESICDTIRHSDTNILNMLKSLIIMNLDPNLRIVSYVEKFIRYCKKK